MQLDLTRQLLDENDEPAQRNNAPLTLGIVLQEAHKATFPEDNGQVKYDRRRMRLRIKEAMKSPEAAKAFELTVGEANTIKDLVGRYALTDISAQVWEMIEAVRPAAESAAPAQAEPQQAEPQQGGPGSVP